MSENVKHIENCLHRQSDKVDVLRLMCMLSLVKDGLPADMYESLKTKFLQVLILMHLVFLWLNYLVMFDSYYRAMATSI